MDPLAPRYRFLLYCGIIVVGALALYITFTQGLRAYGSWADERSDANFYGLVNDGRCNVAVVPLEGEIVPYAGAYGSGDPSTAGPTTNPDDFIARVHAAENDPNIKGILVRIDSGGGSPTASEIMANTLKRSILPVAALIREQGASGAYMAASGAGFIVASQYSDVGSIGITMSYLDNSEKDTKDGVKYVSLSSAPFKDYLSPDKTPSAADRALAERDLKIWHDEFVKQVSDNRHLPLEAVAALADGSAMPGTLALENHLIDQIGDQESTASWFAGKWNIDPKDVIFCDPKY